MRARTSASPSVCAASGTATRISSDHAAHCNRRMSGGHRTTWIGNIWRLPAPVAVSFRRALMWLVLCVGLTYAPDIGRGFVADDFGWIYFSRIDSVATAWRLFIEGAPGFYRPMVALSF